VLLGLAFQLSTLLLVLAGPVPPRPVASTNTVFRPDAGTDAGELHPSHRFQTDEHHNHRLPFPAVLLPR
jgi:hypothetical protein